MSVFKLRATGSLGPASPQRIDETEVRRALELLADPERICQVFGIPAFKHANRKGNDIEGLLDAVQGLAASGNIYLVLNPLSTRLPIKEGLSDGKRLTAGDVVYRRWLFLDIDPIKPLGHKDDPATDAEHELTRQAAEEIRDHLVEKGWPSPVFVDSGNGYYLLWRTYLPVSAHSQAIIRKWTAALAERIKSKAKIDKGVHDAPRLAKIPGTWARKGTQSDDRPWRMCRLVFVPEELEIVTAEMIAEATPHENENGKTPPKKSVFVLKAGTDRATAYWKKALDNECGKVAIARSPAEGGDGRNNALYLAALKLGSLVAGGYGTRFEVESRLRAAARSNGSYDDPGQKEKGIEATIRSGFETGLQSPRVVTVDTKPDEAAAADAVPEGESIIVRASTITPRSVEWLWPGRIPLGKLTTFAGVGGLGKTFVLCDITARITRGDCWPDSTGECAEPGQVLFISGEDDPDDTLVPRLIEMQADLNRVVFLRTEVQDHFTLADLKTLDKAIEQAGKGVRFVAIDPPTAYLGGVDDHKNAELRGLLSPLKNWAARHRIGIVFNTHVNKPQGAKVEAMMRVMGSVAWVNAVRAGHMFARDPADPERRLFVGMKLNIGKERKGLAYRIVETGSLARVEWLGEVDTTADEAINREKRKRDVVAADWLEQLFAQEMEVPSRRIFDTAKAETKLSDDALREAKDLLGIRAHQVCDGEGKRSWFWYWPEEARRRWEAKRKPSPTSEDEGEICPP